MPRYMVAAYLPDDYDPSTETAETIQAIHALNAEMEAAGVLKFACGVSHPATARTLKRKDGRMVVTDGPFIETKEHIGGFLMIDVANIDEALAWVKKGEAAFRGPVEIRELYYREDD
jgi:hypothetical protein